jgi:hypothetical protein
MHYSSKEERQDLDGLPQATIAQPVASDAVEGFETRSTQVEIKILPSDGLTELWLRK